MVMRELIAPPPRTQQFITSPSNDDQSQDYRDAVFWLLDEDYYPSSDSSSSSSSSSGSSSLSDAGINELTCAATDDNFYHDEEEEARNAEATKTFWERQEQLLQETLHRTTSVESKIRAATRDAIRQVKKKLSSAEFSSSCVACGGRVCCRSCLRREVCNHLRESAGYACSIRESKWKSNAEIPAGGHTYLQVVTEKSSRSTKKGEIIRVIIELNFRGEFEMGKPSEHYSKLVSLLPEVFVGKPERMKGLVKILCGAAKRCVMDRNLHLGPWRKEKYVKSKWLLTGSTGATSTVVSPAACESIAAAGVRFGGSDGRGDGDGSLIILPCKETALLARPAVKPTTRGNSLLTFALVRNFPVVAAAAAGETFQQTLAVV